jgi:hypothetical protein
MRIPVLLFIVFQLVARVCMSQCDSTWKKAVYNKISFRYPPGWVYAKQEVPGSVLMSVNPGTNSEDITIKAFEVIQVNPQGHTFTAFKTDFIKGVSARVQNEFKLLDKKDTTVNGLKAVAARALLYPGDKDGLAAKLYAIDGGKNFYLVTAIGLTRGAKYEKEYEIELGDIFKTLTIAK